MTICDVAAYLDIFVLLLLALVLYAVLFSMGYPVHGLSLTLALGIALQDAAAPRVAAVVE